MRKHVEDRGNVIAITAKPEDAVARLRGMRAKSRERLANSQPPLQTNEERDVVLLAIVQQLGILE